MATQPTPAALPVELMGTLRYRELLRHLVARNMKVKYQRSVLGFVWTLLNPLLTVAVLVAVFGYVLEVPVPHYWAFLLSSYFVWNFVLQTLNSATSLLAQHGSLLRSVPVPAEILVIAAAASRFVEFAIEMSFAIIVLTLVHHNGVPGSLLLLPVLVTIQFVLTMGLVLPLATLSVFYDDVQHALPVALLLLFYLSPVLYPASLVPDALQRAYLLNPIASLLTLFQTSLYEGRFPHLPLLAWTAAAATLAFLVGYAIFRRYRPVFAEIL
jgi:lipopolysaccharide transport system permease protein